MKGTHNFSLALGRPDTFSIDDRRHARETKFSVEYVSIYVKDILRTPQLHAAKRLFFLFHIPCG